MLLEIKPDTRRYRIDRLGLVLLAGLAVAAIGAGYAVVSGGFLTAGGLAALVIGVTAFIFTHNATHRTAPPKNTHVHGAARPASEQEAQRAGRGQAQRPRLDDRDY